MNSLSDRIPKSKKERQVKFVKRSKECYLCKKHGGAADTHNTQECKKWDKDGTRKKSFRSKRPEGSEGGGKSYAQLSAEVERLKVSRKRSKKALRKVKKSKKHKYDSDSDSSYNSDSS